MRPAARNSMWRFGFGTPINYSDNEVFCGGVGRKLIISLPIIALLHSAQLCDNVIRLRDLFQSNLKKMMASAAFAATIGAKPAPEKMKTVAVSERELFRKSICKAKSSR